MPELDFEASNIKGRSLVNEEVRKKVTFEAGKTGFLLTMFFNEIN
jgi:hypothetical protein